MVYLIGIAGGTSSGKTSTCKMIQEKLKQDVTILSMDNFYLDDIKDRNYDHPHSFDIPLIIHTLNQIKRGDKIIEIPDYCFCSHKRVSTLRIEIKDCVIFEGILALYDDSVRQLFDIKIFVDTPSDIRLIRRIKRDIQERGRSLESVLKQCENTVIPCHDQFIEPTKKYADLIIPRGRTNVTAINIIINSILGRIDPITNYL